MQSSSKKPATAADVASRAGVSRATVSHILNGRASNFAPETQVRVLEAVEALHYRPSPAGRTLVRGRGDTIVVLAPNAAVGENLQDALDRLTVDTVKHSANVVLRFAGADSRLTIDAILRLRPLAVIDLGALTPDARAQLLAQGVPTAPRPDEHDTSELLTLDRQIAEVQLTELCRPGVRRVLYTSPGDGRPEPLSNGRLDALRAACSALGLESPVPLRVPLDLEGAEAVLRPVLDAVPVAVAAYNDIAALTVVAVARRIGRSVPDEVSVVGVDAAAFGRLVEPRLTSISVDMARLIDGAVRQLGEDLGIDFSVPQVARGGLINLVRGETTSTITTTESN